MKNIYLFGPKSTASTMSLCFLWLSSLLLVVSQNAWAGQRAGEEIAFPSKEFAKLDTFEGLNLEDADKLFTKKDYTGAFAAYKAYTNEFPKGKAMAYALLRMGRCLHLLKKRNNAVRAYQEVIDYFPNDVRYAAGALYHMGQAQLENGDERKCLSTWAKMVQDKDYVGQPNSGTALGYLAKAMGKAKKHEEAAKYNWRIAVNFRVSNSRAAQDAKNSVHYHYTVRVPNHENFKKFYKEVGGWHHKENLKDLDNSPSYWMTSMHIPLRDHRVKKETRVKAANYWVGKIGGKFGTNDGVQKAVIDLRFISDNDQDAWVSRMNAQAAKGSMTVKRLIWWAGEYGRNPKAQAEFLVKHAKVMSGAKVKDFIGLFHKLHNNNRSSAFDAYLAPTIGTMKASDQFELLAYLASWRVKMYEQAKAVLRSIKTTGLTDKELVSLGNYGGDLIGEESALSYFKRMKDKDGSLKATYDWYLKKSTYDGRGFDKTMGEKALAMIPAIAKYPEWAQGTLWPRARILHRLGQYAQAIKAYKASNKEPDASWRVSECQLSMKLYTQAIATIRGLESIGGGVAPRACFRISEIYKSQGNKGKEVEQLRLVLRRYPSSKESSAAHRRLEDLGAKLEGGKSRDN